MTARTAPQRQWQSLSSLFLDIREGFVEITRHSLALLGMVLLAVVLTFAARPSLQNSASEWLMGWLTSRQDETLARAVQDLLPEQAKVTHWLSRKYKVAPLALEKLVAEAWQLGQLSQLPPTLVLAVMAVESGFNPFARGTQGAMGLMQIEPVAHAETLRQFGGQLAAIDPLTNLRIGARLLQAHIKAAGSVEEGLRLYGRASGQANEQAYVERVMGEYQQLERIIRGQAGMGAAVGAGQRP
ncbi:MAG: transglycosylase SLT domain-containing protein [Limnohabitans sp.]